MWVVFARGVFAKARPLCSKSWPLSMVGWQLAQDGCVFGITHTLETCLNRAHHGSTHMEGHLLLQRSIQIKRRKHQARGGPLVVLLQVQLVGSECLDVRRGLLCRVGGVWALLAVSLRGLGEGWLSEGGWGSSLVKGRGVGRAGVARSRCGQPVTGTAG